VIQAFIDMLKNKHIKVGELQIPESYWEMTDEQKQELCLTIMDSMLTILDKSLSQGINRLDVLDSLLQSSMEVNEKEQNFEVTDVMKRIRELIND
jgi:hypothetical protein